MEAWRHTWRNGFARVICTRGLEALRDAIVIDDPRLVQGSTCVPPPLSAVLTWSVEAACAVGFCGWTGEDLETVEDVGAYFARVCFEADQVLGEAAACRHFLNWFDDTPRDVVLRDLLPEVRLALAVRSAADPVTEESENEVEDTADPARPTACVL